MKATHHLWGAEITTSEDTPIASYDRVTDTFSVASPDALELLLRDIFGSMGQYSIPAKKKEVVNHG